MLWGILCSSGQKTRVPELRCLLSHQSNCLLSDNRDNSDLGFPYSCLSLFQTEVFKLDCASSGTLGDISNLYVGSGWGERRVRGKRAAGRKGTHAGQHRHPPLNREKPHWPYRCVRAESPRSCLTLRDPVRCTPLGSSVHGILQARIPGCVGVLSSRGSSQPRIKPGLLRLLHWQAGSLSLAPPGKPNSMDLPTVCCWKKIFYWGKNIPLWVTKNM